MLTLSVTALLPVKCSYSSAWGTAFTHVPGGQSGMCIGIGETKLQAVLPFSTMQCLSGHHVW